MIKIKETRIFMLIGAIMLISAFPISANATEIDKAKEEKASIEQKQEELDQQISALETDKNNIVSDMDELDEQLSTLIQSMNELTADIDSAESELVLAQDELEAAKEVEAEQYDAMKKRIQYIYENGEPSFIEILIDSKDIADFLNQVEVRSKITDYDNNLLDEYIKTTEDIQARELDIENKITDLNGMFEELKEEQAAVEVLVEEKSAELAIREYELMTAETTSSEYDAELKAKLAEIEQLEGEERKRAEEELIRQQEEKRRQAEEEIKRQQEEEKQRLAASNSNFEGDEVDPNYTPVQSATVQSVPTPTQSTPAQSSPAPSTPAPTTPAPSQSAPVQSSPAPSQSAPASNGNLGQSIVNTAMTRLGDLYSQEKRGQGPYVDCSYFTMWAYRQHGISIGGTAAAQGKYCVDNNLTVSKSNLQAGDLVFWSYGANGRFMNIGHVGIYTGNGYVVDASSSKGKVVYRPLYDSSRQVLYGRPY